MRTDRVALAMVLGCVTLGIVGPYLPVMFSVPEMPPQPLWADTEEVSMTLHRGTRAVSIYGNTFEATWNPRLWPALRESKPTAPRIVVCSGEQIGRICLE